MTDDQVWVALKRGGFCNNLKCLLSTMRLAQRDRLSLATTCDDLAEVFENLTLIPESGIAGSMRTHRDWRFLVFPEDPLPDGFARAIASRGFPDADPDGRNIDHEFERIPPGMRAIYLECLRNLTVRPHILDRVESFAAEHIDDDTVALHMRTWLTDHWDQAPKRHRHYFDFARYESLVATSNNVFVASDNADFLGRLVARHGKRVRFFQADEQFSATETAFIELSLLARANHLVGSSLSTFTEMAWWLGGCRAEVTLLGASGTK